ncbi:MAG: hypothetical protein JNL73_01490 [Anaerolineales bacterium]|nr:hypothetical protein [Anaerolineales bacterium]
MRDRSWLATRFLVWALLVGASCFAPAPARGHDIPGFTVRAAPDLTAYDEPESVRAVVAGLLPDLRTLPPWNLSIERPSADTRLLRFANTVWNSGAGPIELYGVHDVSTLQTTVAQRVFHADGSFLDHKVGSFVWHPEHDHWHVGDFATYALWTVADDGASVLRTTSSDKLSYCLIDTDIVAPELSGFPAGRVYIGCGRLRQGLSIGWGDTYEADLPGQELDLGGLADGQYALVSTANPRGHLIETDVSNNTGITYLELRGDQVWAIPPPAPSLALCRSAGWC